MLAEPAGPLASWLPGLRPSRLAGRGRRRGHPPPCRPTARSWTRRAAPRRRHLASPQQPSCVLLACLAESRWSVVQVCLKPTAELVDGHSPEPRLIHAVAVADGDLVVLQRLKIDGDAVRRTDLVLAAIELADVAARVVRDHPAAAQVFVHAAGDA